MYGLLRRSSLQSTCFQEPDWSEPSLHTYHFRHKPFTSGPHSCIRRIRLTDNRSRVLQQSGRRHVQTRADQAPVESHQTVDEDEVDGLPIRIRTQHSVTFGSIIRIVGAGPALGDWNPNLAPGMTWSEGDEWVVELQVPPGTYDFKCVVTRGDGSISEWEPGDNRILEVPEPEDNYGQVMDVVCPWSNTAATFMSFDEDDATARLEAHQENQEEGIQVPEETNSDGINPAAELQGTDGDGLAKLDAGSEQDEKSVEEKIDAVASAIQANENGSQAPKESGPKESQNGNNSVSVQQSLGAAQSQNNTNTNTNRNIYTNNNGSQISTKEELESKTGSEISNNSKVDENLQVASSPTERSSEVASTSLRGVQETSDVPSPTTENKPKQGGTFVQGLAALIGLLAVPIVFWSEYTLKETGCGLPPGPNGYIGAAEGLSYLTIVGLALGGSLSKLTKGRGLPSGPGGLLGLAEGLSYVTILCGSFVLGFQYKEYGYIPSALPDSKCFGEQASNFGSEFSLPSLPNLPSSLPSFPNLPSFPFSFSPRNTSFNPSSSSRQNDVREIADSDKGEEEPSSTAGKLTETIKGVQNLFMTGPQSSMEYLSSGAEDGLSSAELEPVVEELENAAARFSEFLSNLRQKLTGNVGRENPQKPSSILSLSPQSHLQYTTLEQRQNPLRFQFSDLEDFRWDTSVSWRSSPQNHTRNIPSLRFIGAEMSFGVAANTAASASHITQNLASTSHITEDLQADILQLDSAATGIKESVEALEKVASKNLPQSPSLTIQEAGADLQGSLERAEESVSLSPSLQPVVEQLESGNIDVEEKVAEDVDLSKIQSAENDLSAALKVDSSTISEAKNVARSIAESKNEVSQDLVAASEKTSNAVVATIGNVRELLDDAKEVLGSIGANHNNEQ